MPLPSPNLDDLTYDRLVQEAKALIPVFADSWTDHNPSDPGITLVELFAWLTEMVLFQTNQVTDEAKTVFLRLINEPDWEASNDLERDIVATQKSLRQCTRAVTPSDYEFLALKASSQVARAKCVPRRDLSLATQEGRRTERADHVSIVIVPEQAPGSPPREPPRALVDLVASKLEDYRLLGTKLRVVKPTYTPIAVHVKIEPSPDIVGLVGRELNIAKLKSDIEDELAQHFRLVSLDRGQPRPIGKDVTTDEISSVIESVDGVDHVEEVTLSRESGDVDNVVIIRLEEHEVPLIRLQSLKTGRQELDEVLG